MTDRNYFQQLELLRDYAAALTGAEQNLADAHREIAELKRENAALRRIIAELDVVRLKLELPADVKEALEWREAKKREWARIKMSGMRIGERPRLEWVNPPVWINK